MKKSTEDIPEFKTGKTRKWPAKVEPLPGATRRAPLALQPEHAQPSPEGGTAPPDTDPEARRIAAELSKLHKAGAIKNEQDAKFYANVVKTFGGTYIRSTSPSSDEATLTDEQLVPLPPDGLSAQERAAYYQEDLERAIGEEYIAHDPHPPVFHARQSTQKKKRKRLNSMLRRTQQSLEPLAMTAQTYAELRELVEAQGAILTAREDHPRKPGRPDRKP